MKPSFPMPVSVAVLVLLYALPGAGSVLFSETGTPDASWSDDGDLNDWMIGFTEQDVINAGWIGTGAEAAWQLDFWHDPDNRVLAVALLDASPDQIDARDSLVSSSWRDVIALPGAAWTLFCNVGVLYNVEPGFTESIRIDLTAQGEIVDSVRVDMTGNGFSNWFFMAGSVNEPEAETGINQWAFQVSAEHVEHAHSICVMVDDLAVYESEYIDPIVGRTPDPEATPGLESGAQLSPVPLPVMSIDSGDITLTWRTTEGYTYDVERRAGRSFAVENWVKIAEGLIHGASGTLNFSDEGATEAFDGAYYRVVAHAP